MVALSLRVLFKVNRPERLLVVMVDGRDIATVGKGMGQSNVEEEGLMTYPEYRSTAVLNSLWLLEETQGDPVLTTWCHYAAVVNSIENDRCSNANGREEVSG